MALLNGISLLQERPDWQLAVPSLDCSGGNTDILIGIFQAMEELKMFFFLSSTPASIQKYMTFQSYVDIINRLASDFDINYAIHLDHCNDLNEIKKSLDAGFTSVMFDGSSFPFSENTALTRNVVRLARPYSASVEGELGVIGGKEDDTEHGQSRYPEPENCYTFVRETEIDIFAPAIGTVHGSFQSEPDLQWNLVSTLAANLSVPMCLHGTSGLSAETVRSFLKQGFRKVNIATDIRLALKQGIRKLISVDSCIKPQDYLTGGRNAVKEYILHRAGPMFIKPGAYH